MTRPGEDPWQKVLQEIQTGRSEAAYTVAPPDRAFPGTHRWMSDPQGGMPAWIELRWDQAVAVGEVQLIFDTGLHRFLTLSQADGYTQRMHWGTPQPETVRDYDIEMETPQGWKRVIEATGNYQRRRRHLLAPPISASALRVVVNKTNGVDHARVVEIRVYSPPARTRPPPPDRAGRP